MSEYKCEFDRFTFDINKHVKDFQFNDLPFDDKDEELKIFIISNLPVGLMADISVLGIQDTQVRDEIFSLIVENQFECSVEAFYKKELYKNKAIFNILKFKKERQ